MSEPSSGAPIRGAIRTVVETSAEAVVAGEAFSIFVTVQNPFEVPLTLHRISMHVPTELFDVNQLDRAKRRRALEAELTDLQEAAKAAGVSLPKGMP